MKHLGYYIYLVIPAFLWLAGCQKDEVMPASSAPSSDFDIEFDTRATGNPNENDPLLDYFIDGRSVILISQQGDHLSLNFEDYTISDTDPSVSTPNKNLYRYVYYTNPSADWDQGFDFQPYGDYALDWEYMRNNRYGGEYALGALYYPGGVVVNNEVQTDQTTYENLTASNILGAYHKTQDYHSRLRFKFYHLMSAIRVTLLIPVWNPDDNTGFGENSAQSAEMLNIKKAFSIKFNLGSSEEPPVPELTDDPYTYDIQMYLESVSNTVEEITLSDLHSGMPEETDKFRRATFLVIFPPQEASIQGPAMRFHLTSMGGTPRNFVWYNNDLINSSISNARGSLHNLLLYLPRTDNAAILINSEIINWIPAESEFSVVPEN